MMGEAQPLEPHTHHGAVRGLVACSPSPHVPHEAGCAAFPTRSARVLRSERDSRPIMALRGVRHRLCPHASRCGAHSEQPPRPGAHLPSAHDGLHDYRSMLYHRSELGTGAC